MKFLSLIIILISVVGCGDVQMLERRISELTAEKEDLVSQKLKLEKQVKELTRERLMLFGERSIDPKSGLANKFIDELVEIADNTELAANKMCEENFNKATFYEDCLSDFETRIQYNVENGGSRKNKEPERLNEIRECFKESLRDEA